MVTAGRAIKMATGVSDGQLTKWTGWLAENRKDIEQGYRLADAEDFLTNLRSLPNNTKFDSEIQCLTQDVEEAIVVGKKKIQT